MRKEDVNQIITQLKKEFIHFEKCHDGSNLSAVKSADGQKDCARWSG